MDMFDSKSVKPMLIAEEQEPFNSPNWLYELKLDGARCVAYLGKGRTDLRNKRNIIINAKFPELIEIDKHVSGKCILDGEIVVTKNGVPDFFELQRRFILSDRFKIEFASKKYPASFVVYDILYCDGENLTSTPLMKRKEILSSVIKENERIAESRFIIENGIELYKLAEQQKLEGVIGKHINSTYIQGKRSSQWVKFRVLDDEDFILCGYLEGNPATLIFGQYSKDGSLNYKGTVSSNTSMRQQIHDTGFTIRTTSPFVQVPTGLENAIWIEPELVCVIEYTPNAKGKLRHAVAKRLRID